MSLEACVVLKAVVFDVDTSAAHVPIVFEVFGAIDSVSDVESITSKVCHILRKVVVFEVNVGLRVSSIRILVSLKVGRHDVHRASQSANILHEKIFFEQHWSLVGYYQE